MKIAQTLSAALALDQRKGRTTREDFKQLVDLGDVVVNGIYGISWIPVLPRANLSAFEAFARDQYASRPGLTFKVHALVQDVLSWLLTPPPFV